MRKINIGIVYCRLIIFLNKRNFYNNFQIRSNNADNTRNVYARVFIAPNYNGGISQIAVRASQYSFSNSGGLCGFFDRNSTNDLFVTNQVTINGIVNNKITVSDVNRVAAFWKYLKLISL